MNTLQSFIASPEYMPANFVFQDKRFRPLIQITKNAVPSTIGNNDAIENTGDAYANMGILKVIMDHLQSVRRELDYDDSKMYACAAYLHGRLVSNDTLARIYYEQGHKDPSGLAISPGDLDECWMWIDKDLEGDAPKVLADLLEANVWLVYHSTLDGFPVLCNYLKQLFSPLLPTAILAFEAAYRCTYRWDTAGHGPSNCFLYRTRSYRETDAAKVDPLHVGRLLELLGNISAELKATPVGNLTCSLESGPPVQFDCDGRIQGIHKYLQLEGHITLCFFLAQAHDRVYPLHRSAPMYAAGFQTRLFGLASSDICLQHLVKALGMEAMVQATTPPHEAPQLLSPRSAAEIFVASIALFQSKSQDRASFEEVMDELSTQLVQCAVFALEDHGITIQPLVPVNVDQVNTLPRESTGRPVKSLPLRDRITC